MVLAHSRPRTVAVAEESTFATAPANWDQAVQTGAADIFFTVEANVEGLQQTVVENQNSVQRVLGKNPMIRALKSDAAWSFGTYLHGNPLMAVSGSQAADFHLSKLFKNALGGTVKGWHQGLTGGSAAAPEIDADPGISVGEWGFFYDASASKGYFAQITSIAGLVLGVRPSLPFTPVAGDTMYAAISAYLDEDSLKNHTDAQHTTLAAYVHGEADEDSYEILGCKLAASVNALEPGTPPMATFESMVTTFDNSITSPPQLTGSVAGEAPLAVSTGDDTLFYFGNKAGALSCVVNFSVEPVLGVTHQQVRGPGCSTEGVHHYNVVAPGDTGLNCSLIYSASYAGEFEADTRKSAMVQVGTALSSSFGFYYPHLEYAADPTRGESAERLASNLVFRALPDDLSTAATGDGLEAIKSNVHVLFVG